VAKVRLALPQGVHPICSEDCNFDHSVYVALCVYMVCQMGSGELICMKELMVPQQHLDYIEANMCLSLGILCTHGKCSDAYWRQKCFVFYCAGWMG